MTPPRPWLSILVPAHNVERYLAHCLASIHSECIDDVELVVLDDASTDETGDVAREWVRRFPDGRLLVMPSNVGIGEARNTLLGQAKGSYVWFVDADDVLCPGSIGRLKEVVDSQAPDLVMCDFVTFRSEGGDPEEVQRGSRKCTFHGVSSVVRSGYDELASGLLAARQLHMWSKIARREVMAGVRFPPGKVFEDNSALPDLLAATGTYFHAKEAWVGYRRRPDSIMSSVDSRSLRDFLDSIEVIHRKVSSSITGSEARFALEYFCLRGLLWASQRINETDQDLWKQCARILKQVFPAGVHGVCRGCMRRGWVLRSVRLRSGARSILSSAACFD